MLKVSDDIFEGLAVLTTIDRVCLTGDDRSGDKHLFPMQISPDSLQLGN